MLAGPQLLKKFPACYGSRRFWPYPQDPATVYILSQIKPVHAPSPHLPWRSVLLSMPRPAKWPLSFSSPHRIPIYNFLVSHKRNILLPSHFWFQSPNKFWWGEKSCRASFFVFHSLLSPHPSYAKVPSLASHFRIPIAFVPPSIWETKFHTNTKGEAKLYFSIP